VFFSLNFVLHFIALSFLPNITPFHLSFLELFGCSYPSVILYTFLKAPGCFFSTDFGKILFEGGAFLRNDQLAFAVTLDCYFDQNMKSLTGSLRSVNAFSLYQKSV